MAAYVLIAPVLPLSAEGLTLGAAIVLSQLSQLALHWILPHLPADPVYASAAIYLIGDIDISGLAVAGPLGGLLHHIAPSLFAPHTHVADGAAVSAVIQSGATVAATTVARIGGTLLSLVVAMALVRHSSARPWLSVTAALVQVHLLVDLAPDLHLTTAEIDTAGFPFLLAALSPVAAGGQREFFTSHIDHLPPDVVGWGWAIILTALAYATALLVVRLGSVLRRRWSARSLVPPTPSRRAEQLIPRTSAVGYASAALFVLLFTASPMGALSEGEPHFLETDIESSAQEPIAVGQPIHSANHGATPVRVARTVNGFDLLVNERSTAIRGIGYNAWYADLPIEERRQRYERDFSRISGLGANMLEGWFEQQFDRETLNAAHRYGLGVIMPFELNQDHDYGDPAVQEAFLEAVSAWVLEYRDHPAVRIWAPGNELMHRLLYPTIVRGAPDLSAEQRADNFARFYVRLIDRIHELDPNHPVLYRDAEDGYLDRLVLALKADGRSRPWFIYGANVYTPRIEQIIRDWPQRGLDTPIVFSEFAPSGVASADRPRRFEWFWSVIRSRPDLVLGGVVYTWSTNGPEDLDRSFGITDANGDPVDGSVATLHRLFRLDQHAEVNAQ